MNIAEFRQHAAWLSAKPAAAALSSPSPSSPSQARQAATALHQSHTSAEQRRPAGRGTEVPAMVCAPTLSGCSLCDFSILQYRSEGRTEKQVRTISASGPDNTFLCFWVQADVGCFISVRQEGQSTATHSSPQNNWPCWRFWLEDAQGQAGLDFNWA